MKMILNQKNSIAEQRPVKPMITMNNHEGELLNNSCFSCYWLNSKTGLCVRWGEKIKFPKENSCPGTGMKKSGSKK